MKHRLSIAFCLTLNCSGATTCGSTSNTNLRHKTELGIGPACDNGPVGLLSDRRFQADVQPCWPAGPRMKSGIAVALPLTAVSSQFCDWLIRGPLFLRSCQAITPDHGFAAVPSSAAK